MRNRCLCLCAYGAIISIVLFPLSLHATLIINEIMYDLSGTDTDREWIEIFHTGGESIDISLWKFFEGNTNHKLTVAQGDSILSPGTYAVIVDNVEAFKADWPTFGGVIIDSSFSLNNTGENISLRTPELLDIDSVSYSSEWGAKGDDNSLQKIDGVWAVALPTPGALNALSSSHTPSIQKNEEPSSPSAPPPSLPPTPPGETNTVDTHTEVATPSPVNVTTSTQSVSAPTSSQETSQPDPLKSLPVQKNVVKESPPPLEASSEVQYTEEEKFASIAATSSEAATFKSVAQQKDNLAQTLLILAGIISIPLIGLIVAKGGGVKEKITIIE